MKYIFTFYLFAIISCIYPQQKWLRVNGPEGGTITALFAKGDTMLAGVGYDDGVIYYSTDRGSTWHLSTYISNSSVRGFTYTVDGGFIATCDINGICKSTDLISWKRKFTYLDLKFFGVGRDTIGNLYSGTHVGDIFTSSNNGNTWYSAFSNGFPYSVDNFITHPGGDVFAGAITSIIRKKPNSGWFKVPIDSLVNTHYLAIDDSGNVYAILEGFAKCYFSSDTGNTWQNHDTSKYLKYRYVRDLKYNKRLIAPEYHLFLDEPGGILLSDDQGYTWRKTYNGLLPNIQPMIMAVSGEETFLGTEGHGIYKSTDYGENWFKFGKGMMSTPVCEFITDKYGNYFTASWQGGIAKSTDKGETWIQLLNGLNDCNFYSIIADNSNILYAGSNRGLYISYDNGVHWIKKTNNFVYHLYNDELDRIYFVDFADALYRSSNQGTTWLKIAPSNYSLTSAFIGNKGVLFAGGYNGRIYKSSNDGQSWTTVRSSSNSDASIGCFCRTKNGDLFAHSFFEGILRSTDDGESWTLLNLSSKGGYTMAATDKDEIYASVWVDRAHKIFYSSDYGESWKDVTSGLIFEIIKEIYLFNGDSLLLATTQGLWKSNPDSITTTNEIVNINNYYLSQNYPNPFNPITKIKYSIAQREQVSLKIYDILGREIRTLVNEEKPSGEYEVNFTSTNLASGVYIYRITAGQFSESKRMVLLK